ncbi:MAG TPA: saccharopine dehydrogenase C-terminal domain-containing protein [Ferruginibacter sp.]|nr:saccharopine dehydrogenase C-terminal domain-containing protein [Ferruginibacter sp.]
MKKIAVLGAGMIGRTIADDLSSGYQVTSMDISEKNLHLLSRINAKVHTVQCHIPEYIAQTENMSDYDGFVVAVPGFMGFNVLKQLIPYGKPITDISFFNEDARHLHALAVQCGTPVIVDCGVAPGLSNIQLGYVNQLMQVNSFACYVGGLPKERTQPFQYKAPFSPKDVIEEYTRPARLMENGHIVTRPALSEVEWLDVEGIGTLEAFNTDGLRSILHTMGHIPNMKEKTLRYPGHAELITSFIRSGFFSDTPVTIQGANITPLDFTSALLFHQWALKPHEPEFTYMTIRATGTMNGKPAGATFELYDERDSKTGFSSMSRTTGYTCTAAVQLSMHQPLPPGIIFPEQLGGNTQYYTHIMEYLAARRVSFKMKMEEL